MIVLILLSITILLLLNILVIFSLKRLDNGSKTESQYVNISIVIAAKNEEGNINELIHHLKNLDYPPEMFEVILIDDNSTDETIIRIKRQTESLQNYSNITMRTSEVSGKREALSFGINHSKYPYLLITDADCRPEKNWLKSYSKKFEQDYDMLFGIAPFFRHKTLVNRISCFENLRNSVLSFSLASISLPYTAVARNFGFCKSTFKSLEGYSKTKDTKSGDDDLLLREAVKKNMKIGVVTEPGSFVYSETKKTFAEYFQQKARHTQTSFYYLKKHQLILGLWHLLNLAFLFSPLLILFNPLYGILLPVKILIDVSVIKSNQKKFSYDFSTVEIIYLQIFYELLLIIHFLNARFTDVKWK
jgi:cellulose synthase/poly-beta-1,6-N-acetylglucosamine synthase-like glycosyltransferase